MRPRRSQDRSSTGGYAERGVGFTYFYYTIYFATCGACLPLYISVGHLEFHLLCLLLWLLLHSYRLRIIVMDTSVIIIGIICVFIIDSGFMPRSSGGWMGC